VALLLFAGAVSAQEQPRIYRVPFHTAGSMILVDATVNGKPAVLLLDTGADFTIISLEASGLTTVKVRALTANKSTGANGEYVKSRVDLRLAERHLDRARCAVHGPVGRQQAHGHARGRVPWPRRAAGVCLRQNRLPEPHDGV